MDTATLKKQLHAQFASHADVCLVYLFGSQVTGKTGPMSDFDLGILVDNSNDIAASRTGLMHELAMTLPNEHLDIIILNRAPIDLAYAIVAGGVVLYQRDTATRVEYEAQVMSRYGDYLPVLRSLNADIVQGDRYANRVQRYRAALRRTERTLGEIRAAQEQTSH